MTSGARKSARAMVRDYAALSGGELVSKILGFAAFAYLARVLDPEGYGALELAVALSMMGLLVVDFGMGPIGARDVTNRPERASALAREVPAARLLLALVAVGAMTVAALAIGDSPESRTLILCFGLGLSATPWTFNWLLQGQGRMTWVAPAQMIRMFVFLGAALVFVREPGHLVRVGAAEIAASFAVAGYYVWAVRARVSLGAPRFARASLERLLRESAPLGAGQLVWALNQYLPTLMVAVLLGAASTAYYGAAHRVVMSLGSFAYLYFFNLYPSLVRATSDSVGLPADGRDELTRIAAQSFRLTAWLGVLAGLVGGLVASPLCTAIYGDGFVAAGPALAILVWALPLNLMSGHARFALIASGNQLLELRVQAAGLVATLAFSLLLVPWLGVRGAALAMVISAAVIWGVAHVYARRHLGGVLPLLAPLAKPALAALVALALARAVSDGWLAGAVAGAVYAVLAVLLEPRFVQDLRSLITASGPTAEADGGVER